MMTFDSRPDTDRGAPFTMRRDANSRDCSFDAGLDRELRRRCREVSSAQRRGSNSCSLAPLSERRGPCLPSNRERSTRLRCSEAGTGHTERSVQRAADAIAAEGGAAESASEAGGRRRAHARAGGIGGARRRNPKTRVRGRARIGNAGDVAVAKRLTASAHRSSARQGRRAASSAACPHSAAATRAAEVTACAAEVTACAAEVTACAACTTPRARNTARPPSRTTLRSTGVTGQASAAVGGRGTTAACRRDRQEAETQDHPEHHCRHRAHGEPQGKNRSARDATRFCIVVAVPIGIRGTS